MSKIGWVYGVLKQNGVSTDGMAPEEAFEKLREIERNENSKRKKPERQDSIKEQIRASLDELNQTDTLFSIKEIGSDFKSIAKQVQDKLNKTGGYVSREGFGKIQVGSRLMAAGAYLKTAVEKNALTAVPSIIEKGLQIGENPNHKGRSYSTVTFAGKISIADEAGIMAVVVKKTTENFYKVHRVMTPDGKDVQIEKTTD